MNTSLTSHARPDYARCRDCPAWCGGHAAGDPDDDGTTHSAFVPELSLLEIRNHVRGQVERPGGDTVGLCLRQESDPDGPGNLNIPLLYVDVSGRGRIPGQRQSVEVQITSGEARSLASMLVALADRLDLA
ncbi:MAG: hypothetical protein GEV10_06345 [Streptosporangiales bacterium]|nr:hypothetical protein [Streptosporangiales bacterium]